jgi:Ca-activated chloride channel family protein
MKNIFYILVLICASSANAQEWRNSLKSARAAYKRNEFANALKYYQSAQNKAPQNIDLSDEMAQSAYKAGEYDKAEKIYQQSANSKKSALTKANTFYNMGNSRMQKKDFSGAVESYKEALRNNSQDEQTRYNLSEAIRQLKQQNQDSKDKKSPQMNPPKNSDEEKKNKQQEKKNPANSEKEQENRQKNNGNSSRLPNKSVERLLDQLTKAEAETKRKMGGSRAESSTLNSGKDW